MNCLEFRRVRLADPYVSDPLLASHRSECASCRAFEAEIHELDRKIARAFAVPVPEGLAARILLNRSLQSRNGPRIAWQWLSVAASLLVAVSLLTLSAANWSHPERDLVRHLELEQPAIDNIRMQVHEPQIRQVLRSVDLDLVSAIGEVQFASTCVIDGELVAHLVVRDEQNEYTLLLIPTSLTREEIEFQEENWRGIVTAGFNGGSLAVLTPDAAPADTTAMRAMIRRVASSIAPTVSA